MSAEYSNPLGYTRNGHSFFSSEATIQSEAYEKFQTIYQSIRSPESLDEAVEMFSQEARATQLTKLTRRVLKLANNSEPFFSSLNLNNTRLIHSSDFPSLKDFDLDTDTKLEALEKGERLGTQDLLTILAPLDITKVAERELYLLPWPKNPALRSKRFDITTNSDGSTQYDVETRLAELVVRCWYAPHTNRPVHTIRRQSELRL